MHARPRFSLLPSLCLLVAALAGCHEIENVVPREGCPGSAVAIEGHGFGFRQGASVVTFGGIAATQVDAWSSTRIDVRVPAAAPTGDVVVEIHDYARSGGTFTVLGGLACRGSLIPGPAEAGYDAALEALARKYDRGFHAIHALPMGVNSEVSVPLDRVAERETIRAFVEETDGWDLEAYAGVPVASLVGGWSKVAGFTSGVGIAADAYRYGVLRDQGYDATEVDRARTHLLAALDALHTAVAITGTPGVIARGYIRRDIPGDGTSIVTTPLFDENGNPLPPEKTNGTWREDNSGGLYPHYVWEDSCSRDQYQGWATAFGSAWEVIRDDGSIPADLKARLQADAHALATVLTTVQTGGYDLEIQDADGRPTYHAYLNENSFDRYYVPNLPIDNGMHSVMAIGILGALVYAAEDPVLTQRFVDHYLSERDLPGIVRQNLVGVDLGAYTNHSNVNMAMLGMLASQRFVSDPDSRDDLAFALDRKLYDGPFSKFPPKEKLQALYDFVYAAGTADASAFGAKTGLPDAAALAQGLDGLRSFPPPPHWDYAVVNCDADEIASGVCIANDGSVLDLLGNVGWGDQLVAQQALPLTIRPPSNYYWRSNPHEPNGGGNGARLLPGVDFRWVYWYGRWVR